MLHIILMILKILGILILCILGLVLCVGLLVLFCPIRYRLEGSLYGKPEGRVRVTWLFRLINILFSYKENQMEFKICILGIRLGKKKKEKKKKIQIKNPLKNRREQKKQDDEKQKESQLAEAEKTEISTEQLNEANLKKTELNKEPSDKKSSTQKPSGSNTAENSPVNTETAEKEVQKTKWWQLPKRMIQKWKELLTSLKAVYQKFIEFLRNLQQKKQAVIAFIKDEGNKKAFLYTKKRLFKLLCYILPGKVTLKLHYGADDPAVTGMMTGMIYMLYPKSAEKFQLMPEFEHKVFEGELMIKGKVQLVRVFWTILFIYFHKDCNRILKMILKHEYVTAAK